MGNREWEIGRAERRTLIVYASFLRHDALALALSKSAGHEGTPLFRGPSEAAGRRRKARRVADMDASQFFASTGDGMDAGVEAMQEQLPDALSKNPAARPRT